MKDGKAHIVFKTYGDKPEEFVHVVCICPVMAAATCGALNKRDNWRGPKETQTRYHVRACLLELAEMVGAT